MLITKRDPCEFVSQRDSKLTGFLIVCIVTLSFMRWTKVKASLGRSEVGDSEKLTSVKRDPT